MVCFGVNSPGFDSVIFTLNAEGEKVLIFYEMRYSKEESKTTEGIPSVQSKHHLITKQLEGALLHSKVLANVKWYFVYSGYRAHNKSFIDGGMKNDFEKGLPSNTIYLDRATLQASYGTSYGKRALL
jgi:hypothetical protein